MILAAGLGTRLRPLTSDRPKALVTVAGRTLLEIALLRLRAIGVRHVVVNAHHFAEMIVDYLNANQNFGLTIQVSIEEELLDTGGGLKHAAPWLVDSSADSNDPILVHNVDVISTIDLARMLQVHSQHAALATLAVQQRATSRYLLFDEHGHLCGRRTGTEADPQLVRPAAQAQSLAFCGVHVIAPRLVAKMQEQGAFSIIDAYLRLAAEEEPIGAFRADDYYWRDLGRPESVAQATRDLAEGKFSIV